MEDEKLIESVRQFPCLWRVSSKAYKDIRAKENAWKEVAKLVEDNTPDSCCKRWKQLRGKYVCKKKKTKGKTGDPGPEKISFWPLFQILDFLRDTVKHKSTVTNFQSLLPASSPPPSTSLEETPSTHSDVEADEDDTFFSDAQCSSLILDSSQRELSVPPSRPEVSTSNLSTTPTPSSPKRKRRKKQTIDNFDEVFVLQIEKLSSERDEADAFGEHVAARLRRFSHRQRALACLEIDKILSIEFPNENISLSSN